VYGEGTKGHNKSGKKQCICWFNYLIKKMHGGNSVKKNVKVKKK
jgi:hypothetical protein